MATLEKAEALLEELRGASYDAAIREMEEVKSFAAANVSAHSPLIHSAAVPPGSSMYAG
jgi:hypothetical protein